MTQSSTRESDSLSEEATENSDSATTLQIVSKVIRILAAYFVVGMLASHYFVFVSPVLNFLLIFICIVEQASIFKIIRELPQTWSKRLMFAVFIFPLFATFGMIFIFASYPADIWSKNGELTSQNHIGRSDIRVYKESIALGNDNSLVVQRSGLLGTPILYDHLVGRFTGLDSASWDRDKPVLNLTESIINSNRRAVTITFHENGSYEVQKSD